MNFFLILPLWAWLLIGVSVFGVTAVAAQQILPVMIPVLILGGILIAVIYSRQRAEPASRSSFSSGYVCSSDTAARYIEHQLMSAGYVQQLYYGGGKEEVVFVNSQMSPGNQFYVSYQLGEGNTVLLESWVIDGMVGNEHDLSGFVLSLPKSDVKSFIESTLGQLECLR